MTTTTPRNAPANARLQGVWSRVLEGLVATGALPADAVSTPCPAPAEMLTRLLKESAAKEDVTTVLSQVLDWPIYQESVHGSALAHDDGWLFTDHGILFVEDPFDARWQHPDSLLGQHASRFQTLGLLPASLNRDDDGETVIAEAEAFVLEWIKKAAKEGHSDLNLVPHNEDYARLNARVNGQHTVLHEYPYIPKDGRPRYSVLANTLLRLAQATPGVWQTPVDGSFSVVNGKRIEVRLNMRPAEAPGATWPAIFLRLAGNAKNLPLEMVGLPKSDLTVLTSLISRREGLFLVTGPTGSGKTTLLYALIRWLLKNRSGLSIQTVEDPVELLIPGVVQTAINEKAGLTWEAAMRSLMRSDVDVIMLGEIRDEATAKHAVTLALTGHLVIATLHTKSALGTIERLEDLGISRHLIASNLIGASAQRLVRQVCPHCSQPIDLDDHPQLLERYGMLRGDEVGEAFRVAGEGCGECDHGYQGRLLLSELAVVDPATEEAIARGHTIQEIREAHRNAQHRTLWDSGFRLCRQGITTLDEMASVLGPLPAYGRVFTRYSEDRKA